MAAKAELNALLKLKDELTRPLDGVMKSFGRLAGAATAPVRALGSLTGALGKIGLAGLGLDAIASGAKGLGDALGIGLVSEMEQTRAQFMAFTKDAGLTDELLRKVRAEADKTPFSFRELAAATAGLIPASKQAGVSLDDLIKTAEILAASNPAQGLEGAAFALREAVSGDFVSVIERFNLPRQRLKQLKEEGIPALKAIQTAMAELGLDASLVANMAETGAGKWSTFMDTIDGFKMAVATPIFDALKAGLGGAQAALDANKETLTAWATAAGDALGGFITWLIANAPTAIAFLADGFGRVKVVLDPLIDMLPDLATAAKQAIGFFVTGGGDIEMFRGVLNKLIGPEGTQGVIEVFTNLTGFFHHNVIPAFQAMASAAQQALSGDLMGALRTAATAIAAWNVGLATSLLEWGRRFVEWVAPMIPPLLAEADRLFQQMLGWVTEQGPPLLERFLSEWLPNAIKWIIEATPGAIMALAAFVDSLKAWIDGPGGQAIGKMFLELGIAAVRGIIRGVWEMNVWAYSEVARFLGGMLESAKNAIIAHSPSQLWADEVGEPIALGVAAGVRNAGPAVNSAVREVLVAAIEEAEIALVGLADQVDAAERVLGDLEKGLKPVQNAFDATTRQVDALKDAISGLQGELGNIAGGGILLPGEKEIRENIFGLKNAINILEQQKRELIRGGASKDDPAVKAIDEQIKRNRDELAFQEGKLRAEYDGQRHALEEAAKAGTEITQTFEQQYERVVKIKELLAKLNAEELPLALAAQEAARKELEGQKLAIEQQKAVVDLLKEDYDALKEQSRKWKQELEEVAKEAKTIRDRLREAMKLKDDLGNSGASGSGSASAAGASMAAASMAGGARPLAGLPAGVATVTIYQTIDARAHGERAVTDATLDALVRARVVSGTL